ncbi:MAG: protein kinase [Thermoanaerobaculales bacterium]|jgi:serine/threonine-protein kinase|nr:protein kinase [Thermoanaerobaculales bacterium]
MQSFGKYVLVDHISSGGMADVYRAKVQGIRGFTKTVAIKRIHEHLLERTRFLRMFTDEAKIASRLVHPNIVQIYDLGEVDSIPFIAMEYVSGRDLYRVLKRLAAMNRKFPWRLATLVIQEVCTGLQFAHDFHSPDGQPQEIVHRDVSPRNIVLSYEGDVKLTDFGVARARDREEHTEHGVIKGKVRYISPEGARGDEVDRRSDLFSLGIVLAEMLTMAPLRDAPNEMVMLLDIRKGNFDRGRIDELPESLRTVIDRAIATDPDDRYPTAEAMRDDLLARVDPATQPMTKAEVATFMHALFTEDIEREKRSDHKAEQDLLRELQSQDGAAAGATGPGGAAAPASGNPLNVFGGREPGPIAIPALQTSIEPTGPPDLVGNLATQSLCSLIHWLAETREDGRLDLIREPVRKSVFFEEGHPVFATSNIESERFGEYLVAAGELSREQHVEVLDFAARRGMRFTEALLALDVCTPNLLFSSLGRQVRDRILDLFTWTAGTFELFHDAKPSDPVLPLNLRSHTLIHEGVQERLPLGIVRQSLREALQRRLVRCGGGIPADLHLSGRQLRIVRTIEDESPTVARLVQRERDEEWIFRLLYMLLQIDRLELVEDAG